MRSRAVILAIVAVLTAAVIIVGVVAVAGADSSTTLPSLTAPELLAKMGQSHGQTQSISGEVSWTNGLFGSVANAAHDTFGAMPAQNPLLAGGAGRIWLSKDGMRVESQGGVGDQVAVVSEANHDVWLYDYAADTAHHIIVTGAPEGSQTPMPTTSATALTPSAISAMLLRLAPLGAVAVDGQTTVAGRDAYVLKFTPAAADTALGSVQVAVDGKTIRAAAPAGVREGRDRAHAAVRLRQRVVRSHRPVALQLHAARGGGGDDEDDRRGARSASGRWPRGASSRPRRGRPSPAVTWAAPSSPRPRRRSSCRTSSPRRSSDARPFRWAFVIKQGMPLTALGSPLLDLSGMGADAQGAGQMAGPTSAQVYGSGLGSIVLLQTPAAAQMEKQLKQLPDLFDKMDVNGHQAAVVTTPLGGVIVWQQGDTTLVAAGMVPAADLKAFASSVR